MSPLEARVTDQNTHIAPIRQKGPLTPRRQFEETAFKVISTVDTRDQFGLSGKLYVARHNGEEIVTGGECYLRGKVFKLEMVTWPYMGIGWGADTKAGILYMINDRDYDSIEGNLRSARRQYPG